MIISIKIINSFLSRGGFSIRFHLYKHSQQANYRDCC